MRKFFHTQRALFCALIPIPYLIFQYLLFALADIVKAFLNWDGLVWQCLAALAYTMSVLGPVCFVCTGFACLCHSVKKLRSGEEKLKHIILIPIALATMVLSALYFRWYWYR